MEKRKLGRSGIEIPPLMFGGNVFGWTADETTSFRLLDALMAAGFNAIDTADVYSVWVRGHQGGELETVIGNWLKRRGKRDDVIIATKVGAVMGSGDKGLSRAWIMREVDASLQRLRVDTIDLYQAHRDDPDTSQEETAQAFADLVKQGKVRAIGASNFSAVRLKSALEISRRNGLPRYETLQPHYNLVERPAYEAELEPLCQAEGLGVINYYALARRLSHRQVPFGGGPVEEPARRWREEVPQRARPWCAEGIGQRGGTPQGNAGPGGVGLADRPPKHHRADRQCNQPRAVAGHHEGGRVAAERGGHRHAEQGECLSDIR